MLVLSRRPGERIQIGDNVFVTFLGRGEFQGEFRIGVDAPREVAIQRLDKIEGWLSTADWEEAKTRGPRDMSEQPEESIFVVICRAMAAVHGTPLPKRVLLIGDTSEGWGVELNPTKHNVDNIPTFTARVTWHGGPAGFICAAGGAVAAGDEANVHTLSIWLQGIIAAAVEV